MKRLKEKLIQDLIDLPNILVENNKGANEIAPLLLEVSISDLFTSELSTPTFKNMVIDYLQNKLDLYSIIIYLKLDTTKYTNSLLPSETFDKFYYALRNIKPHEVLNIFIKNKKDFSNIIFLSGIIPENIEYYILYNVRINIPLELLDNKINHSFPIDYDTLCLQYNLYKKWYRARYINHKLKKTLSLKLENLKDTYDECKCSDTMGVDKDYFQEIQEIVKIINGE